MVVPFRWSYFARVFGMGVELPSYRIPAVSLCSDSRFPGNCIAQKSQKFEEIAWLGLSDGFGFVGVACVLPYSPGIGE